MDIKAQSAIDAYKLARKWYVEGNYSQAVLEARRAIFFNDSLRISGYIMVSDCYEKMQLYDKAINYLLLAAELEQDDSLNNEILFRIINLNLRDEKPAYALIKLLELHDTRSVYFNDKDNFYLALAYFQIDDFKLSKHYLTLLLKTTPGYDSCYINSLFQKASKNDKRSTVLPAISSAILPGSGQFIEGYYQESANTFLLNSAIAAITVLSFNRLYPLDAFLTMYPFVRRYYLSNIFTAKELALTKQQQVKIEIYNELLDYTNRLRNQPEKN